jgi:hypothetical protein
MTEDNKKLERGFVQFCLAPIDAMFTAVMNAKKDTYTKMLEKIGMQIPKDAKDLQGKHLLKAIMQEVSVELHMHARAMPQKPQGHYLAVYASFGVYAAGSSR